MTRLIVTRHAKAVADGGPGGDHSRTLSERGRRDATRLGMRLLELGWIPDRVLCSDAARTRETWDQVAEVLHHGGHQPDVTFERRLYLADPERVAEVGRDLGAPARGCLLVLGHNPGWERLVGQLTGRSVDLPTAGTALLRSTRDGSWHELLASERWFRLEDLLVPNS